MADVLQLFCLDSVFRNVSTTVVLGIDYANSNNHVPFSLTPLLQFSCPRQRSSAKNGVPTGLKKQAPHVMEVKGYTFGRSLTRLHTVVHGRWSLSGRGANIIIRKWHLITQFPSLLISEATHIFKSTVCSKLHLLNIPSVVMFPRSDKKSFK